MKNSDDRQASVSAEGAVRSTDPAPAPAGRSAASEYDDVTTDAIRERVSIPPMDWPQDQRRAYLGGAFTKRRGSTVECNPYTHPGCAEAWRRGFVDEAQTDV